MSLTGCGTTWWAKTGTGTAPRTKPYWRLGPEKAASRPHSYLEPEGGGPSVLASSMPRLQFPPVRTPYTGVAPQPTFSPYTSYAPAYAQPYWTSWEVRAAWGFASFGLATELLGCGIGTPFGIIGAICAVVGLVRGKRAGGALALSLIVIALHIFVSRVFQ